MNHVDHLQNGWTNNNGTQNHANKSPGYVMDYALHPWPSSRTWMAPQRWLQTLEFTIKRLNIGNHWIYIYTHIHIKHILFDHFPKTSLQYRVPIGQDGNMRLLDLETPNLLSYLAYLVTVWISFLLLLYFF